MSSYTDWKSAPTFVNSLIEKGMAMSFNNPQKGVYEAYTKVIASGSNQNTLLALGGLPEMSEWSGAKIFDGLRLLLQNTQNKNWSANLRLHKDTLRYDQSGLVGDAVSGLLAAQADFYAKQSVTAMIANGTCITGVALYSATQPYANAGGGGTQSNYGTTTMSLAIIDTIIETMRAYTFEGKLLNIVPDYIVCGPHKERMAKEICETPDRTVAVANDGVEAGTRIGVTTVTKAFPGGKLTVIIDPRLSGTYDEYFFIGDSKVSKPMAAITAEAPHMVAQDRDDSYFRFLNNEYLWSVEANVGFAPYFPFGTYGSFVTT